MTESKNSRIKNIISFLTILISVAAFSLIAPIGYFVFSVNSALTSMQNLNIEKAATHMKKAVFIARFCPQPDKKMVNSLNILSTILLAQGNLKEAELVIDQSLNRTRKLYGTEVSLIPSLLAKADLYRRQGNYPNAVKTYQNILLLLSKAGKKNELFVQVQRDLGNLEIAQENYESAEQKLLLVDSLYQELSLNTVNNIIELNLSLGEIKEAKGDYKSALSFYDQAETLYSKHKIDKKPLASLIYNLKAELYLNNGDLENSEPLITKAFSLSQDVSIMEKLQASDLRSLLNLTNLYLKEKKFSRAKRINRQALKIAETRLGRGHQAYAEALSHKGEILFYEGDLDKAFVTLKQAQSLVSGIRKANRINRTIAILLFEAGQPEEAKELFKDVLNKYDSCLNNKHPEYAQTLVEYAELLKLDGNTDAAESCIRKAAKISQLAFRR